MKDPGLRLPRANERALEKKKTKGALREADQNKKLAGASFSAEDGEVSPKKQGPSRESRQPSSLKQGLRPGCTPRRNAGQRGSPLGWPAKPDRVRCQGPAPPGPGAPSVPPLTWPTGSLQLPTPSAPLLRAWTGINVWQAFAFSPDGRDHRGDWGADDGTRRRVFWGLGHRPGQEGAYTASRLRRGSPSVGLPRRDRQRPSIHHHLEETRWTTWGRSPTGMRPRSGGFPGNEGAVCALTGALHGPTNRANPLFGRPPNQLGPASGDVLEGRKTPRVPPAIPQRPNTPACGPLSPRLARVVMTISKQDGTAPAYGYHRHRDGRAAQPLKATRRPHCGGPPLALDSQGSP